MRALVVLLLLASPALADYLACVDANGSVLSVEHTQPRTFPSTSVITVTTMEEAGPNRSFLFDQFGRCRYRAADGGPLILRANARWPAPVIARRAMMRRAIARVEALLRELDVLTKWQADADLVAAIDRSDELADAQAALTQIKQALAGP